MADGEDLLKYITGRVVTYIETPKEIRKSQRADAYKGSWQYRWFGMLPLAFKVWISRLKRQGRNH